MNEGVAVGHVIASDDGLFLLLLEDLSEHHDADQWSCLVLGDFFEGAAVPHVTGAITTFHVGASSAWSRVAP